ncbi:ferritin-like domain-containing protein [Limobrevibacterium gyesilva]|uniref:Ferritin-like domain-containing protein n=1 Tax=Limobrevibacterium gyesilva TaxID=2991712 RepID=A0AA41YNR5_9PROT|nr:ferritin-like domain-containing protein [Limobrevibacterium gyesilva]MCW3473710.1 ferritin-like domain-containing protein [Limobrevibacterium gyesilva]
MKHWRIDEVSWDRFDRTKIDVGVVPLVKAAAMVERNGTDYAVYLNKVFHDDPDFCQAADHWALEEVQHGDALGKWAMLADPSWDFAAAFQRYRDGYKLPLDAEASIRGSRTGELIARCMVETGTSSYYTALAEATGEPVLQQVCRLIAADEYRHFKLFYDHMRRYLGRENIGFLQRLRIAAGRITESEDDELAFAYHCGNNPAGAPYDHASCVAAYMGGAMTVYRFRHIERGMGMVFKAIGLQPHGRLSDMSARLAWQLLQHRRRRLAARLGGAAPPGPEFAQAA